VIKKLWGQACDIGILFDKRKAALGSEQAKKLEYWYNGIRKPGIQEFKKTGMQTDLNFHTHKWGQIFILDFGQKRRM
jgi:hypothetical protein